MSNPQAQPEFEQLPGLYQRWVVDWLPESVPREHHATCLECAMCAETPGDFERDMGYYNRSLKCCTYFPEIPNFLAGRALHESNPGAEVLRAIVAGTSGRGVATLRAVDPDAKLATIYDHHHKTGFGRDPDLLCPYAIEKDSAAGPRCGIWQQRNGVCSTYFCKHVKGLTGFQFWQTLRGFLTGLEWSLSWWAIAELIPESARAFKAGALHANDRNALSLRPDAWSYWPGTRQGFYEACAEKVDALSGAEAVAIAGSESRLHLIELKDRFGALCSAEPPADLRAAPFSILKQSGKRTTIQALKCAEPFEAPDALIPLIGYFDGTATTAETIEKIREQTRVRLDAKLVRRLFDFGILEDRSGGPLNDGAHQMDGKP